MYRGTYLIDCVSADGSYASTVQGTSDKHVDTRTFIGYDQKKSLSEQLVVIILPKAPEKEGLSRALWLPQPKLSWTYFLFGAGLENQ